MDERQAFEEWVAPTLRNGSHLNRSRINSQYTDNRVAAKWAAWQARAALDSKAQPKGAVSCIRASCAATGCDGFCVKRDSDAGVTAAQAPAPAHATGRWTVISPDGKVFTGESAHRAANEANKHLRATDPAEAQRWADMLDRLRAENEAENERLLAKHGTLNCPACGGSGHIGDVSEAPAVGADEARDAARYRWLKSLPGASPRLRGMAIDGGATLKNGFRAPHTVYIADSIDGAIDAAMGEVKPPVQPTGGQQ